MFCAPPVDPGYPLQGNPKGRFLRLGEKLVHKSLVVRAQVCGNLRENVPEPPDPQDVMGRNRHVMLAAPDVRGKAQMTARLPGYLISIPAKQAGEICTAQITR